MADVLSHRQRQKCMSAIRSKDTAPEWIVRRTVFSLGYRYRLHITTLPGKPDLVFPSKRKVILIHGCFWHRHACKKGLSKPGTNREFWEKKLTDNIQRDERNEVELKKLGWKVLIIWECQTKSEQKLSSQLIQFLEDDACTSLDKT